MKATGIGLALIGLLMIVGALFMDVTADAALPSYTPYGALPSLPSSIVNLSKLQSQMLVFVGGWGVCLAGLILAVGGWIGELINPPAPAPVYVTPDALAQAPAGQPSKPTPLAPEEVEAIAKAQDAKLDREMYYFLGAVAVIILVVVVLSAALR